MEKNNEIIYTTPKFVEYGNVVDLTKGTWLSGIPEGVGPWTGWRE